VSLGDPSGHLRWVRICCIPGSGPTISSFLSYGVEKTVSKHPEKFGTGVIEGIAGRNLRITPQSAGRWSRCFPWASPDRAHGGPVGRPHSLRPEAWPLLFVENAELRLGGHCVDVHRNIVLIVMKPPPGAPLRLLLRIPYSLVYRRSHRLHRRRLPVASGLFEWG